MSTSPVISVVMPLYNAKDFVGDAVTSILQQSFSDFEFLILDDSDDGSSEVIKSFKDPRIRLIQTDQSIGLRRKSNLGIREAKGEFIARMEADDISRPDRLFKQLKMMQSNSKLTLIGSQLEVFGNEKGVWAYPIHDAEIRASMIWGPSIAHPTIFFRRKPIIEKQLFYIEDGMPYAEDWEFFYNMKNEVIFANHPEVLYLYRRSPNTVSKRMRPHRDQIMNEMFNRILSDMKLELDSQVLIYHRFITGDFVVPPSSKIVKGAKGWMEHLISNNEKGKYYDPIEFRIQADLKWKQLFYKLIPFGSDVVQTYFSITPELPKGAKNYYLKYRFNKLIGRHR